MNEGDISLVIEHYGGRTKSRTEYMTSCLLHPDRNPSMAVNQEKNVWHCHSCGEGGGLIKLIELLEGVRIDRAREIAASLGIAVEGAGKGGGEVRGSPGRRRGRARDSRRKGAHRGDGGYVPSWRRS